MTLDVTTVSKRILHFYQHASLPTLILQQHSFARYGGEGRLINCCTHPRGGLEEKIHFVKMKINIYINF